MSSIPLDLKLYNKAKEIVFSQYKKNSAYRSMAIQKLYKSLGGKYKENNDKKLKALTQWKLEKWKDVNPNKTTTSYPLYRPTIKINKDTPLTIYEIDKADLLKKAKEKQKIKGKSNLPPFKKK